MNIHPIKTEKNYEEALTAIDSLFDAAPGTEEGDHLDILTTLVEDYERKQHYDIPSPDPIEAIKFRMEQEGLTRKDLENLIGGRGRISEVLSGKRSLTLQMIRRLHKSLKIPARILIKDTSPH